MYQLCIAIENCMRAYSRIELQEHENAYKNHANNTSNQTEMTTPKNDNQKTYPIHNI